MRIGIVSQNYAPAVGGAEKRAEKQARRLLVLGHDVTVVTLRQQRTWKRQEVLNGLPVIRVGGFFARDGHLRGGRIGAWPVSIMLFVQLVRMRPRFDVLHVFQLSPLAAAVAVFCKLIRTPLVISSQSAGPTDAQRRQLDQNSALMADRLTDVSYLAVDRSTWTSSGDVAYLPQSIIGGRLLLRVLRASDAFYQVLSSRSRQILLDHGFRPERIVYIPGSVDVETFAPDSNQQARTQEHERSILCVTRLEYPKGVDVLLHAWSRMLDIPGTWRAGYKPRLCVVGGGQLRRQFERIIADLGVQESVELLGPRSDIIALLHQSWGFVLPSRWEGMPNALLEAMACGLACIATRVSGSEDVIADGINGLLVEPEQPEELARALRRVLDDENLARSLGREARATVVRDYQLAQVTDQCLTLYRAIRNAAAHEEAAISEQQLLAPRRRSSRSCVG